ncbi:MAG: PP2C family protein-serine/threonine phosphatase [Cytophagales bacterium]|nr:PP2C family protein-serine/threonine phosphatase [Cytophagales bacterium]
MMKGEALKAKYDLKELELNSLLEITQAINNNLPEESLYKIYDFTIRANLNIKKLALFVLDDNWECKVNFGTDANFYKEKFDGVFLTFEKIQPITFDQSSVFSEFQIIVPIAHKDRKLAFVFISGYDEVNDEEVNTNFIQALSNIIIVAIENKKLARKQIEQEMIRRELEIAGNVQKFLFPKELPYTDTIKVSAFYQPHHSIGGDYYDFIKISDHRFLFCIADVSGKGIPAALLMSNFQASLRTLTRQTTLLQDIITELNYLVMSNAEGQHFITFFVAIYDTTLKRLKYVNSGHNPPIFIRNRHHVELLSEGSTVLGAFDELPFLKVGIIEDLDQFLFCSFTDGLTEIRNSEDVEFGDGEIQRVVAANADLDPEELNKSIIKAMEEFKAESGFKDDITIFTCRISSNNSN